MPLWTLSEIQQATQAHPDSPRVEPVGIEGISIDSRSIKAGDLFIAIRGDRTDGHLYLEKAMEAGASALLVDRAGIAGKDLEGFPVPVLVVPHTLEALERMARFRRQQIQGRVIAVTGSNGKTSTRDMIKTLAESLYEGEKEKVFATTGNLNNHIGLPLTLARAPRETAILILEMGMNHAGEIRQLSRLGRPHIAVITGIAPAHMEFFETILDIARAKLEIVEGMEAGGSLFYHGKSPGVQLARKLAEEKKLRFQAYCMGRECPCGPCKGKDLVINENGIRFEWAGQTIENPNFFHTGMAWNLFGACLAMKAAGYSPARIAAVAPSVKPLTPRRFQMKRLPAMGPGERDLVLIDDSYNANEHSFLAAIASAAGIFPTGEKCLAAGEMGELGEDYAPLAHGNVGRAAGEAGYGTLLVCGGDGARRMAGGFLEKNPAGQVHLYASVDELLEKKDELNEVLKNLDVLVVKGSRSARMDKLCDYLGEERNA